MLEWIFGQHFKESYAGVDIWTTCQRTTQEWIFGQLWPLTLKCAQALAISSLHHSYFLFCPQTMLWTNQLEVYDEVYEKDV